MLITGGVGRALMSHIAPPTANPRTLTGIRNRKIATTVCADFWYVPVVCVFDAAAFGEVDCDEVEVVIGIGFQELASIVCELLIGSLAGG